MTQRYGDVERAVRKDLRRLPAADRTCALAAAAVTVAHLLDGADEIDVDKRLPAVAQAMRELRATMTELLRSAPSARSGIDDLRARRAARAAG